MRLAFALAVLVLSSGICASIVAAAESPAGRVTGIGGVIVASDHPQRLAAWYRDMLGITLEPWGGAMFPSDAKGRPPYTVWSAFPPRAKEFARAHRDFMLNLTVDDLDAVCRRLTMKGVAVFERSSGPYGRFASVVDPDGTKVELWQAPARR